MVNAAIRKRRHPVGEEMITIVKLDRWVRAMKTLKKEKCKLLRRLSDLLFIKYSEEIIGLVCPQHRVNRVVKKKHLVNECEFGDLVNSEQFDRHHQGQDRAEVTSVL